MEALDNVGSEFTTPRKKRKGSYVSIRRKNHARMIKMPEKEPNKYPRHTAVREVMILPLSTNAMWMRADDVPWMIHYMADEIGPSGSQCVPTIDEDETDAQNCKVDGVRITWDFEGCWTATGTMGPLEGQVLRCRVSTLTKDKWQQAAETRSYGVSFEAATPEQRKQAAYDLLEDFCEQRVLEASSTPEKTCVTPEKVSAPPEDAN